MCIQHYVAGFFSLFFGVASLFWLYTYRVPAQSEHMTMYITLGTACCLSYCAGAAAAAACCC